MSELLLNLLGRDGYLPHGFCITWSPGLLWSMVGSDAVIAASYYSIPVALMSFARRRRDLPFRWLLPLFSAFIFACGTTHLLAIWTTWQPDYALEALTKVITAAVSLVTAIALWPLIPRALKIPSVQQLQLLVASLEAEVQKRRTAEEHLIDSQQNLAVTLASIGAGFIAADRNGRVQHMNAVAERFTGWPLEEARGCSLWEVFVRQGRPPAMLEKNPVDVMLELGITVDTSTQVVVIGRDGQTRAMEVKAALTYEADGPVRGLAMVFRDLSEQMLAQAQANRLAAIVESSHEAIIGKTLDGVITNWNAAAETLFGYTAAEAIGRPVQMLIPPDRTGEEMRILAALAQGQRVPAFETVRLTKDGRVLDVSISISPIRDGQGRVLGASKTVRDISEQRRAARAQEVAKSLEEENRRIQAASRLKSEFLANMSHELRTPLNAIIGFADLLYLGKVPSDSPRQKLFLDNIRGSGRHLLQLINDILDLSKVESGKFEFHPEPLALAKMVNEAVAVLHEQAAVKAISTRVDVDPRLEHVVLDPHRLKQVLYNYLSNALKFTPEGGRVVVRAFPVDRGRWRLEVEDNGPGIAAKDIDRLFVEFQQLDTGSAKAHAGTGLGLALTRRLVEAQGGSVGVHSTPGVATVFHAVLPVDGGPYGEASGFGPLEPASLFPGLAGATVSSGKAVLVVEDEPHDSRRLAEALRGAGFEVALARNAAEALALSGARRFAAITLDLLLPDRPGLELLADIRAAGPNRDVPVLVVTILGRPLPGAVFSVADVLSKPVDGPAVIGALRRSGVIARHDEHIMVVDDDRQSRELMGSVLAAAGYVAVPHSGAHEALSALERQQPGAVILDLAMPVMDGFAFLEHLRARPALRGLPVFIWTSRDLSSQDLHRLHGAAQAVFPKDGLDIELLAAHIRAAITRAGSEAGEANMPLGSHHGR